MLRCRALVSFSFGVLAGTGDALAQSDESRSYFMPVVFFPPTAPVYGAAIEERPPVAARFVGGRRLFAPGPLGDFVGDDFYPVLSTRLFSGVLNATLEARLHTYRANRLTQVNALLNQFVAIYDSPDAQVSALRAFGETQTPELVALEAEAEKLRVDLLTEWFSFTNRMDWNSGRRWRIGAIKAGADGADAEAEFQVVRATAYYQKGLLPQQRGMLRELAIELKAVARKSRGIPGTRAESDAMFFSPETARLRLPPDMPQALREKVGVFNGRKTALKRELRELVTAQEGASAADRLRAFEALADRQWPEIKATEELAEEIRVLLASRLEPSTPTAPPWIPRGVMEMIRSYNADRDTYLAEGRRHLEMALAILPRPDMNVAADERVQRQREYMAQRAEMGRQISKEFHQKTAARYAELELRYKIIRESLSLVAEKQIDKKTGRPLDADTLLRQYGTAMDEFDTFGRELAIYTHYRLAMLQRGLSPEQRRLLFGYALMGLAQPLPYGETMPQRNATRPNPTW